MIANDLVQSFTSNTTVEIVANAIVVLRHAEPMKFVAENVSQSAVLLPCFGDDTSRGVEHPLQLVCDGL